MSKNIGSLRFDFYTREEVKITDEIISDELFSENAYKHYSLGFSFLLVAKLLSNFPPPGGSKALSDGLAKLKRIKDNDDPEKNNLPLLDLFTDESLRIVDTGGSGRWVYNAKLSGTPMTYKMKTKVAYGDEDYFHRATMGAALEQMKSRYQAFVEGDVEVKDNIGAIVCFWIETFLDTVKKNGVTNLSQSYEIALEATGKLFENLQG